MKSSLSTAWGALLLALLLPAAVAQVPAGGEFPVNIYTTADQARPALAVNAKGEMVVVWDTYRVFAGYAVGWVVGRRFDAAGTALGGEFMVNSTPLSVHYGPSLAMDARGGFVVVWTAPDGDRGGVFGRRFDATAVPRGAEFQVNHNIVNGHQGFDNGGPFVAGAADGRFVVAWTDAYEDGSESSIRARRYAADGQAMGEEFRVNAYTTGRQVASSVSMADDGGFAVGFWSQQGDGNGFGAMARRFDAAGAAVGLEFVVNTYTPGSQSAPVIRLARDGGMLVHYRDSQAAGTRIVGRRLDRAGNGIGAEFQVNTYTLGLHSARSSVRDAEENFVIAWDSNQDVAARRYRADGTPRGGPFAVNTYTLQLQGYAAVASDAVGNFVVAWHSNPQDGDRYGVFAQRFGGLRPAALEVDTTGNRVWEPGEAANLRPAWRNVNGAVQTFAAGLSGLAGPLGATYTLLDGTGDYGTVANAASAPCTDCYRVSVSDPAPRPTRHWDATALETITPDTHGQMQRWRLHIGGSFADVPGSSAFYPFIETLLHSGITGGCTATDYCPGQSTSREQMAVFVLLAKEGAGYSPPPCAPPNIFGDVPESSPFCPFIEELSRRGVVGGCQPNRFCPTDPVTREQVAVFVLRTLDPALTPPACAPPNMFDDVPASSVFCSWIEELARRQVVGGCSAAPPLYCPAAPVTREEMAVFIAPTFGLSLYGP
jgi:hypothetical protein